MVWAPLGASVPDFRQFALADSLAGQLYLLGLSHSALQKPGVFALYVGIAELEALVFSPDWP